MDPNTREIIRGFLGQDEVIERLRGDEDSWEALLDLAPVPDLAPHVVHVKATFIQEDRTRAEPGPLDDEGNPTVVLHKASAKVRVQEVVDCPDCGRGMGSRASKDHVYEMLCPRLHNTIDLDACHEGCVIACGAG
jgi:hypothetical protein